MAVTRLNLDPDEHITLKVDSYTGSAYNPQVSVANIDGGHHVEIEYKAPDGIRTTGFDVMDGATGPQGKQGEQGPQGIQGPQGGDYVLTEQDKADIADLVIVGMPVWSGGDY